MIEVFWGVNYAFKKRDAGLVIPRVEHPKVTAVHLIWLLLQEEIYKAFVIASNFKDKLTWELSVVLWHQWAIKGETWDGPSRQVNIIIARF